MSTVDVNSSHTVDVNSSHTVDVNSSHTVDVMSTVDIIHQQYMSTESHPSSSIDGIRGFDGIRVLNKASEVHFGRHHNSERSFLMIPTRFNQSTTLLE